MKKATREHIDIAIVGGGISGLYAAWRLTAEGNGDPRSVALFEHTERLGGRLWSVPLRSGHSLPAELGGMFFSDSQPLVHQICTRVFDLSVSDVTPNPDLAFLRGQRFKISDFQEPGVPPYALAPGERGLPYHQLLFHGLTTVIPDLEEHWPFNSDGTYTGLIDYLRTVSVEDRPLHEWGFWNLLAKGLSNEAYLCLRDIVSSYALFSNWNAYDACLSLLGDAGGRWHRLPGGYQQLPDALAAVLRDREVSIHVNAPVIRIDHSGDVFSLTVETAETRREVTAGSVILAMPRLALGNLVSSSPILLNSPVADLIQSIRSEPACKIFLTFDRPWWRDVPDGPGRIPNDAFSVSHTDLPMRQCYYLGTDEMTGEGLLLASYSDGQSVPFWSALMSETGRKGALTSDVPPIARREIARQLSELHGVEVPAPRSGMFVNWTAAPYGGGWHAWQPGWQSQDVMARLRRPQPELDLHICGEAFSPYQGWVEGALTSAEMLLQEQFGLPAPDWLSVGDDTFAPYSALSDN